MFCTSCGAKNDDNARFCAECGALLRSSDAAAAATSAQASPSPSQQSAQPATPQANPYAQAQPATPAGANVPPAQPAGAYAQTVVTQTVYAKGCFGAAWSDVTSTPGWFGKVALLGLINIVPILNWFVQGYAMRWARGLVFGKTDAMPKQIFDGRNFVNGAFQFVIAIVAGIVIGIISAILGFVPIIGMIAGIVITIFAGMFVDVMIIRAAVADNLGAGFSLGSVWNAFKRKPGSLFGATYIAPIVVIILCGIILLILGLLFIPSAIGVAESLAAMYPHSGSYTVTDPFVLFSVLSTFGSFAFVAYVICMWFSVFSTLLSMRAVGHYVARYAPEWANDPVIATTAHIHDVNNQ